MSELNNQFSKRIRPLLILGLFVLLCILFLNNSTLIKKLTALPRLDKNTDFNISKKWETENFENYSFEYPSGYHIAYDFGKDEGDKFALIHINQGPVLFNHASDSGPTFLITVESVTGKSENDVVKEEINTFKINNINVRKQTFDLKDGTTLYYLQGTVNPDDELYGGGEVGKYFFVGFGYSDMLLFSSDGFKWLNNEHEDTIFHIMKSFHR